MTLHVEPCPEWRHTWRGVRDWTGDTTIPNGTKDVSYMVCAECGEERALDLSLLDWSSEHEYRQDD